MNFSFEMMLDCFIFLAAMILCSMHQLPEDDDTLMRVMRHRKNIRDSLAEQINGNEGDQLELHVRNEKINVPSRQEEILEELAASNLMGKRLNTQKRRKPQKLVLNKPTKAEIVKKNMAVKGEIYS